MTGFNLDIEEFFKKWNVFSDKMPKVLQQWDNQLKCQVMKKPKVYLC